MKPSATWEEHAAGWDVVENGVKLFTLEFISTDPPFYEFNVIEVQCTKEKLMELLNSSKREPIDGLVYQNRLSQCVVADEMFCGGYIDGVARFRDFRPYPWSIGASNGMLFVLGLLLIIIIFLLILEYRME